MCKTDLAPVGPLAALLAVPRGIVAGADVILTVLFVGGAFALLDATGALGRLVGALVGRTSRPRIIVAPLCLAFATLGALENMQEEIVALIPVVLVLSRGLGFGAMTALAMSVGAAAVGAAFGPTNPFQTGLALSFAEMPPLSQPWLRFGLLIAAVAVWIGWTLALTSRDRVAARAEPAPLVQLRRVTVSCSRSCWLRSSPMSSASFVMTGDSTSCPACSSWRVSQWAWSRGAACRLPRRTF